MALPLRHLARTLRVARCRPGLSVPRTRPAGSRPYTSPSWQDRRSPRELERWQAERLKAARENLKESRLDTIWEVMLGAATYASITAALGALVLASGGVGFYYGTRFGIMLCAESVKILKEKHEEELQKLLREEEEESSLESE